MTNITRRALLAATPAVMAAPFCAAPAQGASSLSRVLKAARSHLGASASLVLTDRQIARDVAWCSEFASLCYTEAGAGDLFTLGRRGSAVNTCVDDWVKYAVATGRYRRLDLDLWIDPEAPDAIRTHPIQPRPGDVVCSWHYKSSIGDWSKHTAIVESIEWVDGRPIYHTIDGHWSDTVLRRELTTDRRGKIFAVIADRKVDPETGE